MQIYLQRAKNSKNKFTVIIHDKNTKKTIHFGAKGYSDFTKHKDEERKQRYINRHKPRENWKKSGIKTAGFWSRWILWNKQTLKESIKDVEKKFNIKIKL